MTGNKPKLSYGDILLLFKRRLTLKGMSLFRQVRDTKNTRDLNVCLWAHQIVVQSMSECKEQPVMLPSLTSRLLFPLGKQILK